MRTALEENLFFDPARAGRFVQMDGRNGKPCPRLQLIVGLRPNFGFILQYSDLKSFSWYGPTQRELRGYGSGKTLFGPSMSRREWILLPEQAEMHQV